MSFIRSCPYKVVVLCAAFCILRILRVLFWFVFIKITLIQPLFHSCCNNLWQQLHQALKSSYQLLSQQLMLSINVCLFPVMNYICDKAYIQSRCHQTELWENNNGFQTGIPNPLPICYSLDKHKQELCWALSEQHLNNTPQYFKSQLQYDLAP